MSGTGHVTMAAPSGARYDLAVAWADAVGSDDAEREPRLRAVLGPADLAALEADELFHLVPTARPAGLALVPGRSVVLELRPDEPVEDVPGSAADWLLAHPDRLSTDRWFLAALGQPDADHPDLATTLWGYTDAVGPETDPAVVLDAGTRFLAEQHPELVAGLGGVAGLQALVGAVLGTPTAMDDTPPAVDPLPAFQAMLADAEVEVQHLDDGAALAFPVQGSWGTWICLAEVSQLAGSLVLYGLLPMEVEAERLGAAWELAGRFNADRPTGTVQIDAANGRTVVRTSLIVEAVPSRTTLRRLLDLNIEAMEEALPVFERFAAGASVAAALAA